MRCFVLYVFVNKVGILLCLFISYIFVENILLNIENIIGFFVFFWCVRVSLQVNRGRDDVNLVLGYIEVIVILLKINFKCRGLCYFFLFLWLFFINFGGFYLGIMLGEKVRECWNVREGIQFFFLFELDFIRLGGYVCLVFGMKFRMGVL